jgi:2-polyprenyl-3-methyl-5-hydroxy-6-metoxy-1,4-benzoquinol methylase
MREIEKLLKGRLLDYGCGKGIDADTYNMAKYDPHYHSERPHGTFDTITCHYVLNVVNEDTQALVIEDILSLLNPNGNAYITVRRDFKEDYISQRGTLQRYVILDLPILLEINNRYCIYHLTTP